MKTYIITFQSAKNYGAVLQAYALQKYIGERFGETEVIDYHNPKIDESYSFPNLREIIKYPKRSIFRLMQSFLYRGKNKKINEFVENYMKLTPACDNKSIKEVTADGDVFITGSDQVWNYMITENDENYFLSFVKDKITCSYAASFGISEIPQKHINYYKKALKSIKHVSVREVQGVEILSNLGFDKARVLCDPTLLLERGSWDGMCKCVKEKNKYILVYKITAADKLLDFARDLSKKTRLPIIYIPNDLKAGSVGSLKLNVGVDEWLGYIKNAEYIITNSFHGTVFSIVFGNKFFSEVSQKVNPSTSRLISLLKMFRMEERIISEYRDELLYKELDMQEIENILNEQRQLTSDFFERVFVEEN